MFKNLRYCLCICFCMGLFMPTVDAQFVNFEDTWKEFLSEDKTSNISELVKPSKDQTMNYLKYCLMYANAHFCANEMDQANRLMKEIKTLGETEYAKIEGFKPKYDDLGLKIIAHGEVDVVWKRFLSGGDVTLTDLEINNAKRVCEKGTLAKYNYMLNSLNYCKSEVKTARNVFDNRLLKLIDHTSLDINDVPGLEAEVNKMREVYAGLDRLEPAWKEFMDTDVSPGFEKDFPLIECYSIPTMKVYMLRAAVDVCKNGSEMLEKIKALQKTNTHKIPADLLEKIAWLEKESSKYNGDMATLNKAWKDFVPDDELSDDYEFGIYCHKDAQVKAYTMMGTIDYCEKGQKMLNKIKYTREEFEPKLDKVTLEKIGNLEDLVQAEKDRVVHLEGVWKKYLAGKDSLTEPYQLEKFYCDKIAQTKAWVIEGGMDACKSGQSYVDKIAKLKKEHSLKYDDELECAVTRLKAKVWDCRYWELVKQARKETHAERESFGPKSARVMQMDLNSDKLPCETTVAYSALGNIGVRYLITTYMCENIDLAKMGDPEYYRKIATWVDNEVLKQYCESNMRCKEQFYIYLEGHSDGHPFAGARYKKSLDIPMGTSFTHYTQNNQQEKVTEREITTSLKNNMELGIARAWTVKQQLDFMGVPIRVGAYEHPVTEKGGQYRRVEIELNITNLLLDFYEKRLKELLDKSGIGERPKCK